MASKSNALTDAQVCKIVEEKLGIKSNNCSRRNVYYVNNKPNIGLFSGEVKKKSDFYFIPVIKVAGEEKLFKNRIEIWKIEWTKIIDIIIDPDTVIMEEANYKKYTFSMDKAVKMYPLKEDKPAKNIGNLVYAILGIPESRDPELNKLIEKSNQMRKDMIADIIIDQIELMNKVQEDEEYITAYDVADMLNVSSQTVYNYAHKGEIPSYRLGPKKILFRKTDIQNYLDKQNS